MSLSAAAIRLLAVKGLTANDIADVAEANEATRSTAAVRQKRYRDNKRDVTRDVTPPPNESILTPEDTPDDANASSAPRGRQPGKTMIPADWAPCPISELPPQAKACAEQWPEGAYEAQAEEFFGYWRSSRRKNGDWRTTWGNRVIAQHGKVMRDAKFGVKYGTSAAPGKVVQIDPIKFAESLDSRAALYRKIGREDDAIDAERQAARIRGPTTIGSLVRNIQTGVGQ